MRNAVLGMTVGSVLVIAVAGMGLRSRLYAQLPPSLHPETGTGELIALSCDTADGQQQVTVVDPRSRVMSVYHIEHAKGTISLKSVRNIHADLLMDEFNTDSPLPREIRAILKQKWDEDG